MHLRKYTLTYTVKGITSKEETQDASVDVTEVKATESEEPTETQTATVDVISEEDTQNDNGSVTTSNNGVKGNTTSTNNSSGNSTTTPVAEKPKAHEHNWQPVYTTVHHDAITHTEQQDQGHYETTIVYITSDGKEFTDGKECEDYMYDMLDNKDIDLGVGVVDRETWIPNVVTVTVVDTPAYDEQVISGYTCSCGATK